MPRIRDFDPAALQAHVSLKLQVDQYSNKGFEGPVWQFTIYLPRWFVTAEAKNPIATTEDEAHLEDLLEKHFGGYSVAPFYHRGVGRRGRDLEINVHRVISVLASRWRGTWRFFKALRHELEACTGEEQVLILHQPLWIV